MRVQALTKSQDLGGAEALARQKYAACAGGSRPGTHYATYQGVHDTLLCRIILAADQQLDTVQILKISRAPQEIIFIENQWDGETIPSGRPFYGSESTSAHEFQIALTGTATILVAGGESGKPVVLTSSNHIVCAVTTTPLTFAALVAASASWPGTVVATTPNLVYDPPDLPQVTFTPAMYFARFTLTVNNYGSTSLSMAQGGNGDFLPVALFGGDFTFSPLPVSGKHIGNGGSIAGGGAAVKAEKKPVSVLADHGGVVGGRARVRQDKHYRAAAGEGGSAVAGGGCRASASQTVKVGGGAIAGGVCRAAKGGRYVGGGGAVAGGHAAAVAAAVLKPTLNGPYVKNMAYDACHYADGQGMAVAINLAAGIAVRGGTLTYRVVSAGANCAVLSTDYNTAAATLYGTHKAIFQPLGIGWYGSTWFTFEAVETTADGISATSLPATYKVNVAAPAPVPFALDSISFNAGTRSGTVKTKGGSPPYTGYTTVNTIPGFSMPLAGSAVNVGSWNYSWTSATCDDGSAKLKIIDSKGATVYATLAALGIPACAPAAPNNLRITSASGLRLEFTGGTAPYNWVIVNCTGSTGYSNSLTSVNLVGNGCYFQGGGIRVSDSKGASVFADFRNGFGPPVCPGKAWREIYVSDCAIAKELYWVYGGDLYEGTLSRMSADGSKRVTWGFEDTGAKGGYAGTAGAHSAQVVLDHWGFASFASCDSISYFWPGLTAELNYWYPGGWDLSIVHIIKMEEFK